MTSQSCQKCRWISANERWYSSYVTDFDASKRTSKLQLITGAVAQVLRGERPSFTPKARISPEHDSGANTRTWDPEEWEEDQRFIAAMDHLQAGDKREALHNLARLVKDDPGHLSGRLQLFQLAAELKEPSHVQPQAEWAISYYLQHSDPQSACDAYRLTRTAIPTLEWQEKTLVNVLIAGDKVKDKRVVVDAAKLLIHHYPNTPAMPRALLAGAQVQEDEGRPDLASVTLQNLIARYPLDPLADMARKRLADLEGRGTARSMRPQ